METNVDRHIDSDSALKLLAVKLRFKLLENKEIGERRGGAGWEE